MASKYKEEDRRFFYQQNDRLSRKRRVKKLKKQLFSLLGRRCALCGGDDDLEIDHVNGRSWDVRKSNQEVRWRRYLKELESGIPLRVLCASCNGKLGGQTGWYKNLTRKQAQS